ncbi:integral membrane protein DUF106-domain-containing protein [Hyaloraphidium curvatum]|nr:integral membrane protein DUF106-domain-containing protein [Hyaloraphidium curvatum]
MSIQETQSMYLDPSIRDWVLFPIMIVMVLVGILRQHLTALMNSPPKVNVKGVRETQALTRAGRLRTFCRQIPPNSFQARRKFLQEQFEAGKYLKNPESKDSTTPPNIMTDPAAMEGMMDGMKKNMAMFVPQTVIMSWVTFFFSGFVSLKLPFPLTLRFKSMLQRGIETADMDVTWVSSLSWYFLNLFGLRGIFTLILGEENVTDDLRAMQAFTPGAAPQGAPQQDLHKAFLAEVENLKLTTHVWDMEDVEDRLIAKYRGNDGKKAQ